MATNNYLQSLEAAAAEFGIYGTGNAGADAKWKSLTDAILARVELEKEPIESVNKVLRVLADSNVSIGSFWADLFENKLNAKIKAEKLRLADMVGLISNCNCVDFRSEVAIDKLIAHLLLNETLWVVSSGELASVATCVANSFTPSRLLFSEIGNRVILELDEFEIGQLVSLLEAFAKINFTNTEMVRVIVKRVVDEWGSVSMSDKIRIADATSILRFRSDTFFKLLVNDVSHSGTCQQLASVCVSMKRLKMNGDGTEWWDRQSDHARMVNAVKGKFTPETIQFMNAKEIASCVQLVKDNESLRVSNAVMDRVKHLLTQDPLSRSYRYLAVTMEALSRGSAPATVHIDNLRWLAEWLCGFVYMLPVHDIASLNRSLTKLGFRDHNYHKIWIPYYLERMGELMKDDISTISDNYNAVGMSDTLMGGRHFFYKLGKRFQELSAETSGDKAMAVTRKYRNLQRLG